MRQLFHSLSLQNVEMIDLMPRMQLDPAPILPAMFLPADSHWGYRTHQLAAAAVAERLRRNSWATAARRQSPRFTLTKTNHESPEPYAQYLSSSELEQVQRLRRMQIPFVQGFASQPDASILVTGDSFVYFGLPLASTVSAFLAHELNLPVTVQHIDGNLIQNFQAMFRDRSLLRGKRTVIWLLSSNMLAVESHWPLKLEPPNPEARRSPL